jgi:AcrR family transcriptional regulator
VSRRTRPAKEALSQQTIIDAALALLDSDGMEALTMRRVAQALDTGPASLYVYVQNRDELLALLLDRVLGEIRLPPTAAGSDWRERLIVLMAETIQVLGRHGGIARMAFANVPTGPNSLAVTDTVLGLLALSGISRRAQAWAVDVIGLYIAAAGTEETLYAEQAAAGVTETEVVRSMRETFAGLPAATYPHIAALGDELTSGDGDQRDRWCIEVLINGILATSTERRP